MNRNTKKNILVLVIIETIWVLLFLIAMNLLENGENLMLISILLIMSSPLIIFAGREILDPLYDAYNENNNFYDTKIKISELNDSLQTARPHSVWRKAAELRKFCSKKRVVEVKKCHVSTPFDQSSPDLILYDTNEIVGWCSVCRLAIYLTEEIIACPRCHACAHELHLLEWVKIKGVCPNCGESLQLRELKKCKIWEEYGENISP